MKKHSDQTLELILFGVANHSFAIDSSFLQEVVQSTAPSVLPFVPEHVEGLININGEIIPQIDLAVLLYGKDYVKSLGQKLGTVLVIAVSGVRLAIRVGQIQELLSVSVADINTDQHSKVEGESSGGENTGYVIGSIEHNGSRVLVLDGGLLKETVRYSKKAPGNKGFLGKAAREDAVQELFFKYLIVDAAGKEYAFLLDDVFEINIVDQITPQPRAPAQVAGVSLIRNKPWLILDLCSLLTGQDRLSVTRGPVVLLRSKELVCGLLVSQFRGLEMISEKQIRSDKEKGIVTILRQNGLTLTKVISPDNLFDERVVSLVSPFMPRLDNIAEEVKVRQVELLRFEVDGNAYGVEVNNVRRVVSDKVIEPLLRKHASIMGTIELEGQVVPVINLYEQLGHSAGNVVIRECIVINDGRSDWAVAINETDQIIRIDENRINPVNEKNCKYVSAFSIFDDKLLTILNVKAICSDNTLSVHA